MLAARGNRGCQLATKRQGFSVDPLAELLLIPDGRRHTFERVPLREEEEPCVAAILWVERQRFVGGNMAYAYSGLWRSGTDPYYLWVNANWNSFQSKWQQLSSQNLRLVDLDTIVSGSTRLWSGVWRAGTGGHYLWVNADWNNFKAKWEQLAPQGLRLTTLKVYPSGGNVLYAGVWRPGTDGYYLWVNADWNSFKAKWEQLSAQNMRLVDIETLVIGGQQRWFGVWRAGTGGHYLWVNADWNNFWSKCVQLSGQGLRLTVFKTYVVGGQRRYAGVWRAGTDGWYLWVNASWETFLAKWQELAAQGLRLIKFEYWNKGLTPTVRLHVKVLTQPTIAINTMITNMRQVYESAGIEVQLRSTENLTSSTLNDLDVGTCTRGNVTAEQTALFNNRNNVGNNEVAVYFVRSTNPPLNGCAAHPNNLPSCVVTRGASPWTLGHEVGHVLGLSHVNNNDRLMTGNGTANITNPPPDLISSEITTMKDSPYTINL